MSAKIKASQTACVNELNGKFDAFVPTKSYLLHFSVRDTGIGIAAHLQKLLFQPFTQVHMDAARLHGGTGLGLVISKHLVELMGGNMWLDSVYGKGSTFHFTICCTGSNEGRPTWLQPMSIDSVDQPSRSTLLLIHPLQHTRSLIVGTLQSWGVNALVASSVQEGVEMLKSYQSNNNQRLFSVLTDYRAVSHCEQIDTDSQESLSMSVQSVDQTEPISPINRDDDEVARLHPLQPINRSGVIRYTPNLSLIKQLAQSVKQFTIDQSITATLPIIVLAPLSQQRRIRSLVHSVNSTINQAHSFVTTPIKSKTLFTVLSDALHGKISPTINQTINEEASPSPKSSTSHASPVASQLTSVQSLSRASSCLTTVTSETLVTKPTINRSSSSSVSYATQYPIPHVLIVEDNAINTKVLQRMLARLGFDQSIGPLHTHARVSCVENGQLAVDWVHRYVEKLSQRSDQQSNRSTPSLVVLMDVLMPVLSGTDATREIRASKTIPAPLQPYVIALTANAMAGDEQVCLNAGMNAYISKPITLASLTRALDDAVPKSMN
jgi:CheY-like chemotaxis protein